MLAKRFGLARLADVILINYIVVCTMRVCSQTCFAVQANAPTIKRNMAGRHWHMFGVVTRFDRVCFIYAHTHT